MHPNTPVSGHTTDSLVCRVEVVLRLGRRDLGGANSLPVARDCSGRIHAGFDLEAPADIGLTPASTILATHDRVKALRENVMRLVPTHSGWNALVCEAVFRPGVRKRQS